MFYGLGCMLLLLIGLYAVMAKKDLVKIALGIFIMEFAADLFMSVAGERTGTTSIIILGMAILAIALVIRLKDRFGGADITEIRKLKG